MGSQSGLADHNNVSSKGIRKKVKNSESIALKRYKLHNYILLDLDKVLNDVYCSIRPLSADYDVRTELVKNLNSMAIDIYGGSEDSTPILEAYGSFVMDMFSPQSDLDVSINFSDRISEVPRDKKLQILKLFAKKLCSLQGQGLVKNVESIFSARVPIVKFVDEGTAVECDLSVENKDGILNSQIIRIISQIDDRFQKLCMLVKHWAKAYEVNSALQRTLNSVSITLLVAHHLQTQDPPILPPFSVLFKDGKNPSNVAKRTQKFLNWGQRNTESVGRLFVTFFVKLQSVEFLWRQGLCASLLNGLWISKKWKKARTGSISVEDFIDVSQNVARRVNDEGAKKIYSSINRTVEDLFEFFNGKIAGIHLSHRLFGKETIVEPPRLLPPLNVYPLQPHNNYRSELNGPHEEHRNKRVCLENGYRAVDGISHGRAEERYENVRGKRNRYAGISNGFEELPEIPRFGIYNRPVDDVYRQVSLNGGANGHLVHHRPSGRLSGEEPMPMGPWRDYHHRNDPPLPPYETFGEEPMPMGPWRDYNHRYDPPPPPYGRVCYETFGEEPMPMGPWRDYSHRYDPPPPPYGRDCYETSGSRNFPQPYFGRPFQY